MNKLKIGIITPDEEIFNTIIENKDSDDVNNYIQIKNINEVKNSKSDIILVIPTNSKIDDILEILKYIKENKNII